MSVASTTLAPGVGSGAAAGSASDDRIPDADLFVTEIGVFPKLDSQFDEIYDEITLAISDLVHEQPHAYDLLRGRTFARTKH